MSVNLNLKNRSITNVKQAQAQAHESTYGIDVNFVNSTTVMMLQINYIWMVLNKQQHWYFYLYTFLSMKWDMIMRRKPNS